MDLPGEAPPPMGVRPGCRGPYLQGQGACRCSRTLGTVFAQVGGLWWLRGRRLRGHWFGGCWLGGRCLGLLTLPAFLYFYNQVTALVVPWERRFRIPFTGVARFSPDSSVPCDTEDDLENRNPHGLLMGLVKPIRSCLNRPPAPPVTGRNVRGPLDFATGYLHHGCIPSASRVQNAFVHNEKKLFCSRLPITCALYNYYSSVVWGHVLIYLTFATPMM